MLFNTIQIVPPLLIPAMSKAALFRKRFSSPMAEPCSRDFIKQRWEKWQKSNADIVTIQ